MHPDLKPHISITSDWPKPGIITYDVAPVFKDATLFKTTIDALSEPYTGKHIKYVVGIEARGFVLASALAHKLGVGVILIRKKGKTPPPTITQEYSYEYASHVIEISKRALEPQDQVIVVDDILATGGTMAAAVKLLKQCKAEIVGISCIIEMEHMDGRSRLPGQDIHSLVTY